MQKDKSYLSLNIRSIIYCYLDINVLILKISKLSKRDRDVLLQPNLVTQDKCLKFDN